MDKMMCFVCLGKQGDCLNALRVAHHWFKTHNQKPAFMVSKQYSGILERVSYVEPVIFDEDWTHLKEALTVAKREFNEVISLATYGRQFPIEHRTSSFALDQFERAGVMPLWDKLPLVINYAERKPFAKPTILLCDHSQSSPFLYKQRLYQLLKENFPKHQVLLLSDVLLPHFADFVGWYDKADALVTIETAHRHLSVATKTPVFALAADKPTKWNGTAWHKRLSFYCRYSEFEQRQDELIQSMKETLAGVKKPEVITLN